MYEPKTMIRETVSLDVLRTSVQTFRMNLSNSDAKDQKQHYRSRDGRNTKLIKPKTRLAQYMIPNRFATIANQWEQRLRVQSAWNGTLGDKVTCTSEWKALNCVRNTEGHGQRHLSEDIPVRSHSTHHLGINTSIVSRRCSIEMAQAMVEQHNSDSLYMH